MDNKSNKVRTQIYLDKETHEYLLKRKSITGVPIAEYIRRLIENDYIDLDEYQGEMTRKE